MKFTIEDLRAKLPKQERRFRDIQVEVRATEKELRIGGSIPFNEPSEEMWGFTEIIAPSFFSKSIKDKADVRALWNHSPLWVLGRSTNETLRMAEGKTALDWEADLDSEDTMHRNFARRIERRDVTGTSFGFEIVRDEWKYNDDGTVVRTLIEGKVFDISPVTFPAYPDSEAEARSVRACRFDVASTRAGVDLGELADILAKAEGGKLSADHGPALRTWLERLTKLAPVTEVADPSVEYEHRTRRLAMAARHAAA